MTTRLMDTDGVLVRETVIDDMEQKGYGRLIQPTRNLVLERNQELRKNPEALRKLESMGWELSIPLADWYALRRKYPDLASPHALTKSLAWKSFIGSSESLPYRVRDRVSH